MTITFVDASITLLMMALFIGIWIWAWRKRHKRVFDEMAALPMEDDLGSNPAEVRSTESKDTNHD